MTTPEKRTEGKFLYSGASLGANVVVAFGASALAASAAAGGPFLVVSAAILGGGIAYMTTNQIPAQSDDEK